VLGIVEIIQFSEKKIKLKIKKIERKQNIKNLRDSTLCMAVQERAVNLLLKKKLQHL
jgi:hypothetical protein